MAKDVTPWWKALRIRQEILDASGQLDDVQMSLFQAVYGSGSDAPPYADASYYGEITHPTDRLTDLLAEVAIRIGGGANYKRARAVTRLDQGMGGGKSHACVGAYHLASNPKALFKTEIGRRVLERAESRMGTQMDENLGRPHVVVLPCDHMTPGATSEAMDGPAKNLYERFLWRLFKVGSTTDYNLYERYKPFYSDKGKIGEALRAIDRPVLIIVDEILDYLGNGLDGAGDPQLVAQDVAFIRALLDVVNDVPKVAMLIVMIASTNDRTALSKPAQERRDDLNGILERNGLRTTVTEVADFASILRRRLFDAEPVMELVQSTAEVFAPVLADKAWEKNVWSPIRADWRHRWNDEVAACYPFHPSLMQMAQDEWAQVTGFQRVRSTIRVFAATVHALKARGEGGGWVPLLIGPGDLPLNDNAVREAILSSGLVDDDRTIANYRSLAENEIVNQDESRGTAREQDLNRNHNIWQESNPRATERAGTYLFLTSIVGTFRPGKGKGASAPEVRAATMVPDLSYTITDADQVVSDLVDTETGMSSIDIIPGQGNNKPARYFMTTKLTYRMLVASIRRTITDEDRDQVLREFADKLSLAGPFREKRFVPADPDRNANLVLERAGLASPFSNRLFILDPAQFSLRNGMEQATMQAVTSALGLGTGVDSRPVEWASSAVFAVVNTQRRAQARGSAVEYLARRRALSAPEVQSDTDLKLQGTKELNEGREQLEKAIKRAYQHVLFLAQPDPDGEREVQQFTFDDDMNSSLNGTVVWKELCRQDKAFDAGEFDARALVHNLRDTDFGKSLSEVRADFYNAPRLPLLYGGDADLAKAIFDAVSEGLIQIVDSNDAPVAVTAPNQINLSASTLRLARSKMPEPRTREEGNDVGDHGRSLSPGDPGERRSANPDSAGESEATEVRQEKQVSFAFTRNLLSNSVDADRFAAVFKNLYQALDEEQVSYLQGTLTLQLEEAVVASMQRNLDELGIQITVKPA